jgi:hypothetical protein
MTSNDLPELPPEDVDIPEDSELWMLESGHLWDVKVAPDFTLPEPPRTEQFVLTPLTEEHADSYYAAWSTSMNHVLTTPGFTHRDWPRPMSAGENLEDVRRQVTDAATRRGFTYVALDPASAEVIGCAYVYPPRRWRIGPDVSSWVRADRAELDGPLYQALSSWLEQHWPFVVVDYAERP